MAWLDPETVRRLRSRRDRVGRLLFGDRRGFALFLVSLLFVTLYWRAGIFITDNITLRAGLEAVADGRLWIEPATGNHLSTPGTSVYNGKVYGRNYGQLFISLPVLWALQALGALTDLRVGLVTIWHLLALLLVVQCARLFDRRRIVLSVGGWLVLTSFFINVLLATPLTNVSLALLALQITAAVAAGFIAVGVYRVVELKRSARAGLLAGGAVAIAMPIGFWATIPKRHVFAALVCVEALYLFTRSRQTGGLTLPHVGTVPVYRAGAYASAGLLSWDHAAAGLFVVIALLLVDIPTARSNDARSLTFVGAVFLISLIPMFLTNILIAGDPFRPPRVLYGAGVEVPSGPTPAGGGGAPGTGGGSNGGSTGGAPLWYWGPIAVLTDVLVWSAAVIQDIWIVDKLLWLYAQADALARNGLAGLTRLEEVYHTFVHSRVTGIAEDARFRGINLAMLEVAPVLGAMVAAGAAAAIDVGRSVGNRVDETDMLAVLLVIAFVLLYNDRLPLNTTLTVRYLLPLYPLGAYLLARSPIIGRLLDDRLPTLIGAYGAGLIIGGPLLVWSLALGEFALAEAMRVHAGIGLAVGLVVALLSLAGLIDERTDHLAAIAIGIAAAVGTLFLLLSGLQYFSFVGEFILPGAGAVSEFLLGLQ
ncbi:MAG: hypothetical protein ABEH64_12585 [Salinirussus sp.]